MVILRTRNKITDFLMILAWASPFNYRFCGTGCFSNQMGILRDFVICLKVIWGDKAQWVIQRVFLHSSNKGYFVEW